MKGFILKKIIHLIHQYVKKGFDACLPSICLLCHLSSKGSLICKYCHNDILLDRVCCLHCGCSLISTQSFCGECLQHHFEFTQLHAVANYQSPFPELIKKLKYDHHLLYADLLGHLLADSILQRYNEMQLEKIDYLIPVPLHIKKHRERGFNQAQLITDALAKCLPVKIPQASLIRDKSTNPQEGLSRHQRLLNLQNAFSLNKEKTLNLEGKYIVLIDDVVTTGATINSLCKILLAEGVKKIDVWCICRTELH